MTSEESIGRNRANGRRGGICPHGHSPPASRSAGRNIASLNPIGFRNTTVFDAAGQTRRRVDANGHITSTLYDLVGRSVAEIGEWRNASPCQITTSRTSGFEFIRVKDFGVRFVQTSPDNCPLRQRPTFRDVRVFFREWGDLFWTLSTVETWANVGRGGAKKAG